MADTKDKIAELFLQDPGCFFLYQDAEEKWISYNETGCPSLAKQPMIHLGFKGIEQLLAKEEEELYHNFLEQIHTKQEADSVSKRVSVNLHLKSVSDCFEYYELIAYTGDGCIISFRHLNAEEIYRIELAENITNDKYPMFFAKGAMRLMQENADSTFALIQFDVAKFKVINEQYGEAMGDEILKYFIHTLTMHCNQDQLFARLTADVFMILTKYKTKEDILALIEELNAELTGYRNIPYTLFWGVSYLPDKDAPLRKYGDAAALARQSIKGDALKHIAFFDDHMRQQANEKKYMEDRMDKALANGEFVMFLQPKFQISTGKLIGAEALVRWIDPQRGMMPPISFIPLFEQNGFVVRMDEYIWEEACKCLKEWKDKGFDPVPISINVSRKNLEQLRFVDKLESLVQRYEIDQKLLEIEITESLDVADVKAGIRKLKERGFVLLMDDFGSGYSSLNTLKDTMFDVIKIDRSFLQDFISSDRGKKIVEHTIQMTNDIGLDMIAEGVENQEQADILEQFGCDKAQGFFYAKPMPKEEFNQRYMSI